VVFLTDFGKNIHFAVGFAPVLEEKVVPKRLAKSRRSAKCVVLRRREAKLRKRTHLPLTRQKAVFGDKSLTGTQFLFLP